MLTQELIFKQLHKKYLFLSITIFLAFLIVVIFEGSYDAKHNVLNYIFATYNIVFGMIVIIAGTIVALFQNHFFDTFVNVSKRDIGQICSQRYIYYPLSIVTLAIIFFCAVEYTNLEPYSKFTAANAFILFYALIAIAVFTLSRKIYILLIYKVYSKKGAFSIHNYERYKSALLDCVEILTTERHLYADDWRILHKIWTDLISYSSQYDEYVCLLNSDVFDLILKHRERNSVLWVLVMECNNKIAINNSDSSIHILYSLCEKLYELNEALIGNILSAIQDHRIETDILVYCIIIYGYYLSMIEDSRAFKALRFVKKILNVMNEKNDHVISQFIVELQTRDHRFKGSLDTCLLSGLSSSTEKADFTKFIKGEITKYARVNENI